MLEGSERSCVGLCVFLALDFMLIWGISYLAEVGSISCWDMFHQKQLPMINRQSVVLFDRQAVSFDRCQTTFYLLRISVEEV